MIRMRCYLFFAWLFIAVPHGRGARILGVFPMPSYSHYTQGYRILEALLSRGHHVTLISTFKQQDKHANLTEIYLDGLLDKFRDESAFYEQHNMLLIQQIITWYKAGYTNTEITLKRPEILQLLHSNTTYDVVLFDQFLNEALVGFSYHYKSPIVYLVTIGSSIWNNNLVCNPAPLSYVQNLFFNFKHPFSFSQRLQNLWLYVWEEAYRRLVALPYHNKLLHDAFPNAPHLNEILYGLDPIILINSHVSYTDAVPHVPNMIEIGGFHPKKSVLPADLKTFLDVEKNGVVFFSMGSNLKSAYLPVEKRNAILKALGHLKMKVLWKWEQDTLPGQPSNVKLGKWFPQQAILAHPNVKAFISHGGLLSTIEAVHYGVPIIGIPIYGDQMMNINRAVNNGYAISLPFHELTEDMLTNALGEILNNKTYGENIKQRSALMKDRVVHPVDTAVFWIEHVIRHKGATHFRNKGMDLTWYEYYILDVGLMVFGIIFIIIFLLIKFTRKLITSATIKEKQL